MKEAIINLLSTFSELNVIIVQNMKYERYKELISEAKWMLTFGEGLDGYLIESIFSGGIGFAVYNNEFFTPEFQNLKTIYHDIPDLMESIKNDINDLDTEQPFQDYQKIQYSLCSRLYSSEKYIDNLNLFYSKNYTLK